MSENFKQRRQEKKNKKRDDEGDKKDRKWEGYRKQKRNQLCVLLISYQIRQCECKCKLNKLKVKVSLNTHHYSKLHSEAAFEY